MCFTTVHNDSTGAIVRIDIKRVEYFGFKWKFLLKEGTDELISGDLPEQKDEVERVHGENYPDCRLRTSCSIDARFAIGSTVLGKCQEEVDGEVDYPKEERQIKRVLETKIVSQRCTVYRKIETKTFSQCAGWGDNWWSLGKVTHVNAMNDRQSALTTDARNVTVDFAIPIFVWDDEENRLDWPLHMLKAEGDYVSIVSRHQIGVDQRAGHIVPLDVPLEGSQRAIGLTYRSAWRPTARQRRFLDHLRRIGAAAGPAPPAAVPQTDTLE